MFLPVVADSGGVFGNRKSYVDNDDGDHDDDVASGDNDNVIFLE